jgi:hypothetical protein
MRKDPCLVPEHTPPLIVSLTSYRKRLSTVHICIESLLAQSLKPDHILLWLCEPPDSVPDTVKEQEQRGLTIRNCDDIGPYKKIMYCLKENPGSTIVTADDDKIYPGDWLKGLVESHAREPQCIHCYRAHLMIKGEGQTLKRYADWDYTSPGIQGPSLRLFPTGASGVLYPPGCLHEEVFNREAFMLMCRHADDVWLKAMSLMNRVSCMKVSHDSKEYQTINGTQDEALWKSNLCAGRNDEQIRRVFESYDLYRLL